MKAISLFTVTLLVTFAGCKKEQPQSAATVNFIGNFEVREYLGIMAPFHVSYTLQIMDMGNNAVVLRNLGNRLNQVTGYVQNDTLFIPLQSSYESCAYDVSGFITMQHNDSIHTNYKAVNSCCKSCPWIFANGNGIKTQ